MYEFEKNFSQPKQKKFFDIIPPVPKRQVSLARQSDLLKGESIEKADDFGAEEEEIKKEKPSASEGDALLGGENDSGTIGKESVGMFARSSRYLTGTLNVFKKLSSILPGPRLFSRKIFFSKRPAIFLGGALLAAGGFILFVQLPRVRVALYPVVQDHSFSVEFLGNTHTAMPDLEKGILPVELLSFSEEAAQEFASTGIDERIEKARGTITVYNAYSSEPQVLVERTRFMSEDGHLFRTTKKIVVPGAKVENGKITSSSYDVEVEAGEAGSEYNIGPSTFSIPGFAGTPRYLGFYGKSKSPMRGGFVGEIEIVSKEDMERAEQNIGQLLEERKEKELLQKVPQGFRVLGGAAAEIKSLSSSKKVGETGKNFTVRQEMIIRAFIAKNEVLDEFVDKALGKILPPNMREIKNLRSAKLMIAERDVKKETLRGNIDIAAKMMYQFAQEDLQASLRGKRGNEVERILFEDERVMKALVSFWPVWVKNVPRQSSKIKIEVVMPQE